MKVLIICGAGIVSGKEIMTLHLLKGLKERGHQCYCITAYWGSPDFRDRLQKLGIPFFILRIGFISKTFQWSAIRMTFIQLIHLPMLYVKYAIVLRKARPDVVIHTNFHHLFLLYPILAGRRQIYWSHEIMANSKFYIKLFGLFKNKIATFIGVSEAVSRSLRNAMDAHQVITIKNGIPFPVNFVKPNRVNDSFVLGVVGQISRQKGHQLLFKALEDHHQFPRKVKVFIFGNGEKEFISELKRLVKDIQLEHIVFWKGFVKEVNLIYEPIDILVVPSIEFDSYPTTVMEAGLRGIPVITSSIGGLPEMVRDGFNGFLFETGNHSDLKRALLKAIGNSEFGLLEKQAFDFARQNFGIDLFTDAFEKVIKKQERE